MRLSFCIKQMKPWLIQVCGGSGCEFSAGNMYFSNKNPLIWYSRNVGNHLYIKATCANNKITRIGFPNTGSLKGFKRSVLSVNINTIPYVLWDSRIKVRGVFSIRYFIVCLPTTTKASPMRRGPRGTSWSGGPQWGRPCVVVWLGHSAAHWCRGHHLQDLAHVWSFLMQQHCVVETAELLQSDTNYQDCFFNACKCTQAALASCHT